MPAPSDPAAREPMTSLATLLEQRRQNLQSDTPEPVADGSDSVLVMATTLTTFALAIYVLYWHVYAGESFSLFPILMAAVAAGIAGSLMKLLEHGAQAARKGFREEMVRVREPKD